MISWTSKTSKSQLNRSQKMVRVNQNSLLHQIRWYVERKNILVIFLSHIYLIVGCFTNMVTSHWTKNSPIILHILSFWHFCTSLTPFFHILGHWLVEPHNLPYVVSHNPYVWCSIIINQLCRITDKVASYYQYF